MDTQTANTQTANTVVFEAVNPETHVFKDGQVVLNKDGTPKKKPGRKVGTKVVKRIAVPSEAVPTSAAVGGDAEVVAALSTLGAADKKTFEELLIPNAPQPPVMNAKELADKVPLSVGKDDAVPAKLAEVNAAPAMGISALAHSTTPVEPPKPTKLVPVTAVVSRTYGKIGAPEAKDETIEVKAFVTQPATVEIGYGLTLNIGNYESARVDVKVSVPCYREETDAAYEYAKAWAEERVKQEVLSVRKMAAPQKSNPF